MKRFLALALALAMVMGISLSIISVEAKTSNSLLGKSSFSFSEINQYSVGEGLSNVITNGDFENELVAWRIEGEYQLVQKHGSQILELGAHASVRQEVSVQPNKTYRLSLFSDGIGELYFIGYSDSGEITFEDEHYISLASEGLSNSTFDFTTVAGTTKVEIKYITVKGYSWLDNLTLANMSDDNKLVNGDFREGLKGWLWNGNDKVSVEKDNLVIQQDRDGVRGKNILFQSVGLEPNTEYRISADGRLREKRSDVIYLAVTRAEGTVATMWFDSTETTRKSKTFVTDHSGLVKVSVVPMFKQNHGEPNLAYIGNVILEKVVE